MLTPCDKSDRFARLLDWLYPPRCRACAGHIDGYDAEFFCNSCWPRVKLVCHPLCEVCGRPFLTASGDDHRCGTCLARVPRFASARAWACYPSDPAEHPLRHVVQKFKYGRKVSLGRPLGRLMAYGCGDFVRACKPDVIVPVPLHRKRLRWRGFNQAVLLGRQVSRFSGVPLDAFTLWRKRETSPQTQLSEEERLKNVRGAFAVRGEGAIRGRTVLLVDDVYTSGATVNECSRVLLQGGAEAVHVLTLARAVW